jgi:hypothetical protein
MMKGLALGLTIAAVVIVVVGVTLAIVFTVFYKQMNTSGVERIQERFPTEQIVLSETTANFFGLESRGSLQIRGNGVLVLTQDQLWFSRFIKREDITIPTNTIEAVRLVDSHLGKRILGRQLIYVQFEGSEGPDSVAWLVEDPTRWQSAIASLLENP